jgi:hypothetical protein
MSKINIKWTILLVTIILCTTIFLIWYFDLISYVTENFSNESFSVLKKYDNEDKAQLILQTIDNRLIQLIDNFNFK